VIVQRINEEANALREQLRRTKERYDAKCEKLHSTSEELDRTQRLLKKMKSLVDDKKLAERDELDCKLTKAREDIEAKDTTIRVSLTFYSNRKKWQWRSTKTVADLFYVCVIRRYRDAPGNTVDEKSCLFSQI